MHQIYFSNSTGLSTSAIRAIAVLAMLTGLLASGHAVAGKLVHWHGANLQALQGERYELGERRRRIITAEYANGGAWGDFFVFADYVFPESGASTYYIEPTLRGSCTKLLALQCSTGAVADVYLALNLEQPKNQSMRTLLGISADLDVPGFRFFKPTLSWRDNPDLTGSTYQLTLVWNSIFTWFDQSLVFEGFADFAGQEGKTSSNLLTAPRLLLDAGQAAGRQADKLWLGLEWQYWHNKFGLAGTNESVPQLQLKWVL